MTWINKNKRLRGRKIRLFEVVFELIEHRELISGGIGGCSELVNRREDLVQGADAHGGIAEFLPPVFIPLLPLFDAERLRIVPRTVAKQHFRYARIVVSLFQAREFVCRALSYPLHAPVVAIAEKTAAVEPGIGVADGGKVLLRKHLPGFVLQRFDVRQYRLTVLQLSRHVDLEPVGGGLIHGFERHHDRAFVQVYGL